jgi:hypothetical protein
MYEEAPSIMPLAGPQPCYTGLNGVRLRKMIWNYHVPENNFKLSGMSDTEKHGLGSFVVRALRFTSLMLMKFGNSVV